MGQRRLYCIVDAAYDGWLLHTSSQALRDILPLVPKTARLMAWVKPFAAFKANVFHGTTLYFKDRMTKTLDQLEQAAPAVVFVEKKIYLLQVPKDYLALFQSWTLLKDYLVGHYDIAQEGEHLLVLKRKP